MGGLYSTQSRLKISQTHYSAVLKNKQHCSVNHNLRLLYFPPINRKALCLDSKQNLRQEAFSVEAEILAVMK